MKTNTFKNLKFLKLLFIAIALFAFNFITAQYHNGYIQIWRGGGTIPIKTILINTNSSDVPELVVYQGDKVVFTAASSGNPSVKGLTDTNVMRWAGECLFMENEIPYQGAPKPFLIFDSNVHGVKKRRYPASWANGKHLYPKFKITDSHATLDLTWIANGRYELPRILAGNTGSYNMNTYLKSFKSRTGGYDNYNVFFTNEPSQNLDFQRNNQKEGLNMELLEAYTSGKKFVAGLDPDELLYNNLNSSNIVGNANVFKKFDYVANDQWKIISTSQRGGINQSMYEFLNGTKEIFDPSDSYSGHEIVDKNLYEYRPGSTTIENKLFDYEIAQPMFNNKRPVYYNPDIENTPIIANKTLEFSINGEVTKIKLAVLSPLEGKRINKQFDDLTEADRKNPKVNFYGIIEGPIHVARYQKNVTYTVSALPNSNYVDGAFSLVYTYEDAYGILHEQRGAVSLGGVINSSATFNIQGGGYHDITLRYKGNKNETNNDNEVIIAGKELIDIDLRFIFSPENPISKISDYSYNPSVTLNASVKLNENKGNGEGWFLGDNNPKLKDNNYGLNHGYKDHNVVRTYTLDRDDTMVLTVLDADPHSFVHYQPDFYLSERRLSKRLTNADLASNDRYSKLEWFVAKDANFSVEDRSLNKYGRSYKVSPKNIWPTYKGNFYLKAVYNNTSAIVVKIVQKELNDPIDQIIVKADLYNITNPSQNLGQLAITNLSDDQFELLHRLSPSFYKTGNGYGKDRYKIYKIKDILSAYTYGYKQTANQTKIADRYDCVGEHKRFSDMNNYDCRFTWEFKNKSTNGTLNNGVLFYDFTNYGQGTYWYNYQGQWFPSYWVRHLDSKNLSSEIPSKGDARLREFPQTWNLNLATYNGGDTPYEPWQVRLPWIAQTVQGYRTRWNIKCIYDVKKLFDRTNFGPPSTNATTYANNVIGDDGIKILPGFDNKNREMQEFYYMLINKEIVVVDAVAMDNSQGSSDRVNVKVRDNSDNVVWSGDAITLNVSPNRLAESKNEASLPINDNGSLCTVYPNPNSVGIFSIDINVPKENSNVDLQLSDLNGRVIYNSLPKVVNSRYSTTIGENLNLPKGVYLLTVKINELIETKKLIVN